MAFVEITSDTKTPDKSRVFYVNGKRLFIRGTNWIPEAMLRHSDERTYAELRYTRQSGVNLLRMWGGGIAESDYFFQLCDELGFAGMAGILDDRGYSSSLMTRLSI